MVPRRTLSSWGAYHHFTYRSFIQYSYNYHTTMWTAWLEIQRVARLPRWNLEWPGIPSTSQIPQHFEESTTLHVKQNKWDQFSQVITDYMLCTFGSAHVERCCGTNQSEEFMKIEMKWSEDLRSSKYNSVSIRVTGIAGKSWPELMKEDGKNSENA